MRPASQRSSVDARDNREKGCLVKKLPNPASVCCAKTPEMGLGGT